MSFDKSINLLRGYAYEPSKEAMAELESIISQLSGNERYLFYVVLSGYPEDVREDFTMHLTPSNQGEFEGYTEDVLQAFNRVKIHPEVIEPSPRFKKLLGKMDHIHLTGRGQGLYVDTKSCDTLTLEYEITRGALVKLLEAKNPRKLVIQGPVTLGGLNDIQDYVAIHIEELVYKNGAEPSGAPFVCFECPNLKRIVYDMEESDGLLTQAFLFYLHRSLSFHDLPALKELEFKFGKNYSKEYTYVGIGIPASNYHLKISYDNLFGYMDCEFRANQTISNMEKSLDRHNLSEFTLKTNGEVFDMKKDMERFKSKCQDAVETYTA